MSRKRLFGLLLAAVLLALPALLLAQGASTYAVLPFKVNDEKFQYMSRGAQSMLSSRLAWLGYFEPSPTASVDRVGARQPANPAEAASMMSQIGTDFLLAGKVDFQDKQATVELRVWDRKGHTWTKTAQTPMEGLVPAMERLAADVRTEVFKRPGEDKQTAERKEVRKDQQSKAPVPKNADFVVGDTGENAAGTNSGGQVMNAQFRYEGGAETPGRWQSQSLRYASTGMVVGDFVGDKKNRVIITSENTVYAYEFYQNTLKPIGEYKLGNRNKMLRVSLFDLDRDGKAEIIVSTVNDPDGNAEPKSFVLSYANGKFDEFMKPLRMYLSVVRTPPTYAPTLLGQYKGAHAPFDENGVSEMMYSNGELQQVSRLKLPSIVNLFNFAYLPEGNTHKVVALNEYSYMKVFTPDGEPQFTQEEGYNSSNNYVVIDERLPGMDMGKRDSSTEMFYYIPFRMIPVSFDSKGKYELLVNKDISVASQIFTKFRRFSQGEVHSLFWDGVGMSLAWKTRRIKGTVVDMGLEDLQNKGNKQLIVCLNTYSGAIGMSNEKTVVVAYDLIMTP